MFEKFQEAVFSRYLELKKNNQLPFSEKSPSTKDLKLWCLEVYEKGLAAEDEKVFVKFFVTKPAEQQLGSCLFNFPNDKFRAMKNFLEGKTKSNPDRNIIKLLAVLLDVQPRPYQSNSSEQNPYLKDVITHRAQNTESRESIVTPEVEAILTNEEPRLMSATEPQDTNSAQIDSNIERNNAVAPETQYARQLPIQGTTLQPDTMADTRAMPPRSGSRKGSTATQKSKRNKINLIAAGITILIVSLMAYSYTPKDCMSWNGERYIAVDCQDKTQRYLVLGLDEDKLDDFQKINRIDTLGAKDVGHIWYSKINHEIEFFTAPGFHPVHQHRSLKAATAYIFETYAGANAPKRPFSSKDITDKK